MRKIALSLALATAMSAQAELVTTSSHVPELRARAIGTFTTGLFDESAQEIAAYSVIRKRLYITNAESNSIDFVSIADPADPVLESSLDMSGYGGGVNSVAVKNGYMAVAVEANVKTDAGSIVIFDLDGGFVAQLTVGALPDMVTFTEDGNWILVANEGEPNDEYTIDPEGSISVIDFSGRRNVGQSDVRTADFTAFNDAIHPDVRVFGPGASVAQDLEPEFITLSADGSTAYVSLQENNALAIVDVASASVTDIVPLGLKNHNVVQNALDASNRDDAINIRPWNVYGMYLPDALASYDVNGQTYILSANEGDARDYDGYSEETRVEDLVLDPTMFPNAAELQQEQNLGRLKTTTANGDWDGDGDVDQIHAYGARSFSIWNSAGELVYDSGSDFERILADVEGANFNSTNDENDSFDNRSDDKGPEPEGVTIGAFLGRTWAFIGLERHGGVMIYDITNPVAPRFVEFINTRDFTGDAEAGTAGDLGPEGLVFIPPGPAPGGHPLLVVTNEVSGSTTIYRLTNRFGDEN